MGEVELGVEAGLFLLMGFAFGSVWRARIKRLGIKNFGDDSKLGCFHHPSAFQTILISEFLPTIPPLPTSGGGLV